MFLCVFLCVCVGGRERWQDAEERNSLKRAKIHQHMKVLNTLNTQRLVVANTQCFCPAPLFHQHINLPLRQQEKRGREGSGQQTEQGKGCGGIGVLSFALALFCCFRLFLPLLLSFLLSVLGGWWNGDCWPFGLLSKLTCPSCQP